MKKLLYLASESINLKSGGGLANKAFLDSLMRHYPEQVDVIQLRHNDTDVDQPHYYYVPALSRLTELTYALRGHFHRLYKWLPTFLEEHGTEYSHCIMNQTYYGDLIPTIIKYGIKVAVIHHNYEVKHQLDNKLPATLYGLTPYFVKRNERMALSLASLNMYLTENDYQTFKKEYTETQIGHHSVIGIYETANALEAKPVGTPLRQNVMVICGSLGNKQTELAVHDVFEHYYTAIHNVFGDDFQLIIAGRNPGPYIRSAAASHHHVDLVPNPENMEDVINRAGIFICPGNCGSGLKLRIMDGLRLGVPILTHRVSAPGYENFYSKPWFRVYDNKESFSQGLKQIIQQIDNNPSLRKEISANYRSQFSFDKGDERIMKVVGPFLQDS